MTDLERLAKFEELKELINGPEADTFKNEWDGRFSPGHFPFILKNPPYNLLFYEAPLFDVKRAPPINGYYVGISGNLAQWEEFFEKRIFQVSISVKHNEHPFTQLGSALACRQNQSMIAQVMRLIAKVMAGEAK